MRTPFLPALALSVVVFITMTMESVFSFPFLAIMIWLTQLPLLIDEQAILFGAVLGICLAVLYHLPFAIGMAIFLSMTFLGKSALWRGQLQTRNGLLTLVTVLTLLLCIHTPISLLQCGLLSLHFLVVIVGSRVIAMRRLRHR